MLKRIGPSFKKTLALSYKEHKNGFYVYAKDSDVPTDQMIKYVGRYLGRPVIANSRIDKYDGDSVTFHYKRHEDDVYVEETIPVLDFIRRLIIHIPEKNFKRTPLGFSPRSALIGFLQALCFSSEIHHTS